MLVKAVFEINGKEIELTEDGALQLRDDINRIFGPPATVSARTWIGDTIAWPPHPVYGENTCLDVGEVGAVKLK